MGDRTSAQQPHFQSGESLSDRLLNSAANLDLTPALQQAEAKLTAQLSPAQIRAMASWMRAIASTYDHQAPAEVGHSFRSQASRLDQFARQRTSEADTIIGTVMSGQIAYLMTSTEQFLRQELSQPGEAESPTEPCSEAEFCQAYHNPEFTVLLGAERLEQRFDAQGD